MAYEVDDEAYINKEYEIIIESNNYDEDKEKLEEILDIYSNCWKIEKVVKEWLTLDNKRVFDNKLKIIISLKYKMRFIQLTKIFADIYKYKIYKIKVL